MGEQDFTEKRSGKDRRCNVVDRRLGLDRRRGPGRRRTDERKSAEEGHMTDEQFEFLMAIDEYKRKNDRPFPTWTEVLEVIKAIGRGTTVPVRNSKHCIGVICSKSNSMLVTSNALTPPSSPLSDPQLPTARVVPLVAC